MVGFRPYTEFRVNQKLTKMYGDFLCARFVRYDDLLRHFALLFVLFFCFYQFRFAARNFALLARGLITNSSFSAMIGALFMIVSSDSSPKLLASLK